MKKSSNDKRRLSAKELRIRREWLTRIRAELASLRERTDETAKTAGALTDLILCHQQNLLSDTTIVRETAVLLQHAVQNLDRIAQPLLAEEFNGSRSRRR